MLGALVHSLKQNDAFTNTLIILMMDHGQAGKQSLYEGGTRILTVAHWPSRISPQSVSIKVANIDFAPTFYAAAGITASDSQQIDGQSWLDHVVNGTSFDNRPIFMELNYERAMVNGCRKLLYKYSEEFSNVTYEQYNICTDPLEETPITETRPLKEAMYCHLAHTDRSNTGESGVGTFNPPCRVTESFV